MPSGLKNQDSDYDDDVEIDDEYDGTNPKQRQHKGKGKAPGPKGVGGGQDVNVISLSLRFKPDGPGSRRDILGKPHTHGLGMLSKRTKVVASKAPSKNFSLEVGGEGAVLRLSCCVLQLTAKCAQNEGYSSPLGPCGEQLYAT